MLVPTASVGIDKLAPGAHTHSTVSRSEHPFVQGRPGPHELRFPWRILLSSHLLAAALLPVAVSGATFTDANWMPLGLGVNGTVHAITGSHTNLYVAGEFGAATNSDGTAVIANYIVNWNGSTWTPLGSGMNGPYVQAIALSATDLYAAGRFTGAGVAGTNFIAKWNGNTWSPLGSGMNNHVFALAVAGGDLYAGGEFSTAGGTSASSIAKWNGSIWLPLGSGLNNFAWALAVSGTNVYVGGAFTTAGGSPANLIAGWNGSTWSSLGQGVKGGHTVVRALSVAGSDLFVGGDFTLATNPGGMTVPVNYVAKWNGSVWSALGLGLNNPVQGLAISGSNLYAGGTFNRATNSGGGTVTALGIAKWDGTNWSALGSGLGGQAIALAVSGNDLYVGGTFSTAGGKPTRNIGLAYLLPLPTLSLIQSGSRFNALWPSFYGDDFALQQNSSLTGAATWTLNSASVLDDGTNRWVPVSTTSNQQFFRLRR
jgi:hypothetical protein